MENQKVFALNHPWDRNFYSLFVFLCWLGVSMGFEPAVNTRYSGNADYEAPLFLQVHVFAFVGWLLLLTLQILLIRFRHINFHRTLGLAGFALIPLMVVSGMWSEFYSQQFYSPENPENLQFYIFPVTTMLVFPVLAFTALCLRKSPASHKRMMILATISIVGAAYFRWWGLALETSLGTGYWGILASFYAGYFVLLLVVVLYDLLTRKQIHRVHRYAVPVMALIPFIVSGIYHSQWWPDIAREWLGL